MTVKPFILALCGVVFLGEAMTWMQFAYGIIIVASSVYFLAPKHMLFGFFRDVLDSR